VKGVTRYTSTMLARYTPYHMPFIGSVNWQSLKSMRSLQACRLATSSGNIRTVMMATKMEQQTTILGNQACILSSGCENAARR
jgi:hypothetical protein